MCCLLQYTLNVKIIKKRSAIKTETNHKRKNCTSCQSLSVTPADTVLTYCYVKRLIWISKRLVREYKCYRKHGITCTFTLMLSTKNMTFHACNVRVQVLICYGNTRLQRIFNIFCQKVLVWLLFLIRAMFWDTSKDVWECENLGFISLNVPRWSFIDNIVYCNILRFNDSRVFWTRKSYVYRCNCCSHVNYHHSWSLDSQ